MQLIYQDDNKKMYLEKGVVDKIYTFINIRDYAGYKNGDWYEDKESYWKLMFCEEYDNKNYKKLNIEATCDKNGNYIKLLLEQDCIERTIMIKDGGVLYDVVEDKVNQKYGVASKFVGYEHENLNLELPKIEDYLLMDIKYKTSDGKVIKKYPDNLKVLEFLETKNKNKTKIRTIK